MFQGGNSDVSFELLSLLYNRVANGDEKQMCLIVLCHAKEQCFIIFYKLWSHAQFE